MDSVESEQAVVLEQNAPYQLRRYLRADPMLPRKAAFCVDLLLTVPQTDSGGRVENTKALGRTRVKELGKLAP